MRSVKSSDVVSSASEKRGSFSLVKKPLLWTQRRAEESKQLREAQKTETARFVSELAEYFWGRSAK